MLPSAVIQVWVMNEIMNNMPFETAPYYILNDAILVNSVLAFKKHTPGTAPYGIFLYVDVEKNQLKWAVIDLSGDQFYKLKLADFKYSTEEALLRIPYKNGSKDILFNLDILDGIVKRAWQKFKNIRAMH